MARTEAQYREGRQSNTERDIVHCAGDPKKLNRLLRDREKLARIYADDGAVHTAHMIEEIDMTLIRETILLQTNS